MRLLLETFAHTGQLHHAYLIEGEREHVRPELFDFIEGELRERTRGNPDFWHSSHEILTINEARELIDRQSSMPITGGRKIFVIELWGITHEAQNALLKVIEEPTPDTHFFIIAPTKELFLPTLRSRLFIVTSEDGNSGIGKEAKEFLAATPAERLRLADEIAEEKNKARAAELIDGMIIHARAKQGGRELLEHLLQSRAYLNDRSPSLKLILEHIAITC